MTLWRSEIRAEHGNRLINEGASRRSFLRAGASGAFAAGFGGLLSACGGQDDPSEISFWNFYGPGGESEKQDFWFRQLARDWNATHDVKVRLRYVPTDDYTSGPTLQTSFSAGAGPDVFLLSPGDILRYYNGGVLMDLTDYLPKGAREDFLPAVLDTRLVGDRVYGLPMEVEPLAIYYDKQAFEKAKLSEGDLPRSWDDLLGIAERLTTPERYGLMFDTVPGYYQNFTWYPFFWMAGGSVLSKDQRRSTFDGPAARTAFQFWQDAVQSGVSPRIVAGGGGGDILSNLGDGYCAMQQVGIWAISELAEDKPDLRYGVMKLPVPEGGKYETGLGSWAFVANNQGRNPKAAAEFVVWALGSWEDSCIDRIRRWCTEAKSDLPPRYSVRRAAERHGAYQEGPMRLFANEIMENATAEPRYPSEIYRAISDALQACQLKGEDPASAAAGVEEQINTFLSSYDGAAIL